MTLADSVRALLRAVRRRTIACAAALIAKARRRRRPLIAQIDHVDIFELYEDRAIEAPARAARAEPAPEFDAYRVDELLVKGAEGRGRVRFEQASGWWQRIRVKGNEERARSSSRPSRRPRARRRGSRPTQRGLVDGFVERRIETTANDPKLGQTLFELLVPNDFKPYAPDRRKLALMLNPEAAAIPWELMHDGFDRSAEPMAVASGMVRQLLLGDERGAGAASAVEHRARGRQPHGGRRRFPSLAGAAEEAAPRRRCSSTMTGYEVSCCSKRRPIPMSVLSAVHEQPWRILHLAAHGVFEFEPEDGSEPVSGLVLDDGLFFTAAEADQLRYVPELVFINCCHLGQTQGRRAAARGLPSSWRPTSRPSSSRWARGRWSPRAGPSTMPRPRRSPTAFYSRLFEGRPVRRRRPPGAERHLPDAW